MKKDNFDSILMKNNEDDDSEDESEEGMAEG